MTMPPPASFLYGKIRWKVAKMVADTTSDLDVLPELEPLSGTLTISPPVQRLRLLTTDPPQTIFPQPQTFAIGGTGGANDGLLKDKHGNPYVTLLANDTPGMDLQGWPYQMSYSLSDGISGTFELSIHAGDDIDLTLVSDVPTPDGTVTIGQLIIAPVSPAAPTVGTVWIDNS